LLKQRHEEMPKLIDACKGYMQYEQKTLQMVVEARNAYQSATIIQDKAQADNLVTGALTTLFAVAESYPDLIERRRKVARFSEIMDIAMAKGRISVRRNPLSLTVSKLPSPNL
jgi:hypothetical protein